eukprot:1411644-Ditylum_brightwellii.AAC.1
MTATARACVHMKCMYLMIALEAAVQSTELKKRQKVHNHLSVVIVGPYIYATHDICSTICIWNVSEVYLGIDIWLKRCVPVSPKNA